MLMPNSGRYVRLCIRLTILNLLKVYMNLFLRFFFLNFLKFLNRLYIYRSNGLWSGATPISDGIFFIKGVGGVGGVSRFGQNPNFCQVLLWSPNVFWSQFVFFVLVKQV